MMSKFIFVLLVVMLCSCHSIKRYSKNPQPILPEFYGDTKWDCFERWKYEDLKKMHKLKVLYYNRRNTILYHNVKEITEPNWVIGVNDNLDTITIIDLQFRDTINENETIWVVPKVWTEEEKKLYKPAFYLFYDMKYREFLCAVKVAYYGKIDTICALCSP